MSIAAWLLIWSTQVHGWIGPTNLQIAIPGIVSQEECERLMNEIRVRGRCIEYKMAIK